MFGDRFAEWSSHMNTPTKDRRLIRYDRLAGLMSLSIFALYMAGQLLSQSLQSDSFAESAVSITGSETLDRMSLGLMLLGSVFTILPAGALYVSLRRLPFFYLLLKGINPDYRQCSHADGTQGDSVA